MASTSKREIGDPFYHSNSREMSVIVEGLTSMTEKMGAFEDMAGLATDLGIEV